jgi:hypothetical protein
MVSLRAGSVNVRSFPILTSFRGKNILEISLDKGTQKEYKGPNDAQSLSQLGVRKSEGSKMETRTTENCPWCGSVISREKFVQIESQIREQEHQKLKQAEASMRQQLEKDLEQQLERERQAARQRGKEEAEKELAALRSQATAERQKATEQVRLLQASEAEARKRAQEAADTAATLKKNFDQRLEAEKRVAEKQAREQAEASLEKDMEHQRIILEQTYHADLAKQRSDFQKQNEAALKEVQDLKHKLEEQKTANRLGDGAEVDLYETLRREFPDDNINRVVKGQPGPDIRHRVLYKGEVCGQIVYDSKNQQQWRDAWLGKLHQDQIDSGAEHAILAATVFPAGRKEIWIDESGVIVVNPARAVHIAHLLRKAMVELHVKGLGQRERAGKTNKLYEYIRSNEYNQQFDLVESLTDELLEVDVKEKKAHDKVWKERGQLLIKQQHALREIDMKVAAIIEASDSGLSAA